MRGGHRVQLQIEELMMASPKEFFQETMTVINFSSKENVEGNDSV